MHAVRRVVVGIPAALLLAGAIVFGLSAGMANTNARAVSGEVGTWASLAGPRPDTVASLQSELDRTALHAPDRAYVEELQGVIAARRRDDPSALASAKFHFLKALQSRPVSPYTWANVAHVDYELGQTGDEFEAALRQAARLGRFEAEVQNTVVNYGLAVREEVTPQTRAAIDQTVADAMRRNPLETLQIAARRGRLDVACRGIVDPGNEPSKRYLLCQQWERTS